MNYNLQYGFSLMAKPAGPLCNLNCTYCYYLEKKKYFLQTDKFSMQEHILEKYIKEYIAAIQAPVVTFAWQGGEPFLAGVDFFQRAIALQKLYAGRKKIENVLQTNGTLLNEDWCRFLKDNNFLIGISVDGPEDIHNFYRKYNTGKPTFNEVMRGLELLIKFEVPFNTLTVVQRHNSQYPQEIYRFLKSIGSGYMQFIPVVERLSVNNGYLVMPTYTEKARISDWSVLPLSYGQFLISIFEEWVRNDVGKVFVQQFDAALANWVGVHPGVCVFNDRCGDALVIEYNGNVYSCDHFVFPEYYLGNILEKPLIGMVSSMEQNNFGLSKVSTLPNYCINCEYRFACNGECPKYRFCYTPDGEYGLNYLCEGYKVFFRHIHLYMQYMGDKIKVQQPPSDIMGWIKKNG